MNFDTKILHIFLLLFFVIALSSAQAIAGLSDPFDKNAVYNRTVYVGEKGNDQTGSGSQESPYATLQRAARDARPGTKIVLLAGSQATGMSLNRLHGEPDSPILITGSSERNPAVFTGGRQAMQLSEPRYVILQDFIVEGASRNGINIDDGGTFESPAEHVIVRNVTIRDIGPDGNRDGLKLSGVDHFRVEDCFITRPGNGGSAIDMVGCHDGVFVNNHIVDCGSTGIQAKGGSARILIYSNRFENAGGRAVNMGGSTGMQFFRPIDAPYEASHITVWANVFIRGQTPVAFVGCEYGLFAHNTVYHPEKWVARILQENNHERLAQSSNNVYANNIVVIDDQVNTFVNIGPNTKPETFIFANNLWYHTSNSNFRGPNLPGRQLESIVQKNPNFKNINGLDFHLQGESPAIGAAGDLEEFIGELPIKGPNAGDFDGKPWNEPPAVGAYEKPAQTSLKQWKTYEKSFTVQ